MIRYQAFFHAADEILLVTAARFCLARHNGAVGFAVCPKILRALRNVSSQERAGSREEHLDRRRVEPWWRMSTRIGQEMGERKRFTPPDPESVPGVSRSPQPRRHRWTDTCA